MSVSDARLAEMLAYYESFARPDLYAGEIAALRELQEWRRVALPPSAPSKERA